MKVSVEKIKGLSYVLADDFFSTENVERIKKELSDIRRFAQGPSSTNTALDENGAAMKRGSGVFLDDLYGAKRSHSDILSCTAAIFNQDFVGALAEHDASFKHLRYSTRDLTLVNYYTDGDYYLPHHDTFCLTAVWFFALGDVSGGEFVFPEYGVELTCVDNRMVLFSGCVEHGAKPVVTNGGCRISIAKFISYKVA